MHNPNKSNYINIAIVVISLGIVIFGLLFLQQLFFGRKTSGTAAVTTSSSNSAYRSPDYYLNKSDGQTQLSNTNNSLSQNTLQSSQKNSLNNSLGDLKTGEVLVKYIGGDKNNFDILNCNLTQVYFCKAGVKLTLGSSNKELKEGKNYKLSNGTITDTAEGLSMDSIDIIPVE